MIELHQHYNLALVALSFAVSVLGSFTALQLALNISLARNGRQHALEVLASGAVMGGGAIWAMHFIAMLACDMGLPVNYDILLTVLSALLAMAACSVGLAIVAARGSHLGNLAIGGVLMGVGVAGMHYLGIAAMVTTADISFNLMLVAVSVAIAIVASMAALWLAFNLRGNWQIAGSAVVMGVAVCGMHYTGMAAMQMQMQDAAPTVPLSGLSGDKLAGVIFVVVVIILLVALGQNVLRRRRRENLAI